MCFEERINQPTHLWKVNKELGAKSDFPKNARWADRSINRSIGSTDQSTARKRLLTMKVGRLPVDPLTGLSTDFAWLTFR
jgi:hypothetical protein